MYTIEKVRRQPYLMGADCLVLMDGSELPVKIVYLGTPDNDGLRLIKFIVRKTVSRYSAWVGKTLEGFCHGQEMNNWRMARLGENAETIRSHYEQISSLA